MAQHSNGSSGGNGRHSGKARERRKQYQTWTEVYADNDGDYLPF